MTTKSRTSKPKPVAAIKETSERLFDLKREKGYTVQGFADTFDAKLTTVCDWLNARVLPRAEALRKIAEHFGVTTDWLLGIEGAPKRRDQWRTDATLAHDLAAYVAGEACAEAGQFEADWLPYVTAEFKSQVSGDKLLRRLVDLAVDEVKANVAHFSNQAAMAKQIERIRGLAGKGQPVAAADALAILKRLHGAPGPTGLAMPWRPDPASPAKRKPAKGARR